ncbi:MAG TPA: hypothetical protein VEC17_02945 [Candidatus Binatia bacterium]|nr:hypothetical protein [Candidatus Binatia bacterium]
MQTFLEMNFSDFRSRIHNPNDRVLFDEAVLCAKEKAFRSGYIMIWIAAAESLRAKIVELALKDAESGKALREIEKYEQQNLSPDKLILDKAFSLGLIIKDEHKKLEHIRDMRNSYAHPTGVAPQSEELFVAIQQVSEYVLSRPTLLKHGYVANLISSVFQNRHFLDDDSVKIYEYAVGLSHRLHPDVLPYLVRKFCESYDSATELLIKRRAVYFVRSLIKELKPNFSSTEWQAATLLNDHPRSASLFLSVSETWSSLPVQAQDMCFGNLVEPTSTEGVVLTPSSLRIIQLKRLEQAGLLNNKQKEKFKDILKIVPYEALSASGYRLLDTVNRIIAALGSHNWYAQNPAIDAVLMFGLNQIGELESTQQEQLGRNILQAAEGNSSSARHFIVSAIKGKYLPESFLVGLLKECFTNEKLEFRIKRQVLKYVLETVLAQDNSKLIIESAIKDIEQSSPNFIYFFDAGDVGALVGYLETDCPGGEDIKKLKEVLVKEGARFEVLSEEFLHPESKTN